MTIHVDHMFAAQNPIIPKENPYYIKLFPKETYPAGIRLIYWLVSLRMCQSATVLERLA